jgi:hypothetical protein
MPKPSNSASATGISFPLDAKGARSSTSAGKAIFIRAARAVQGGEALAEEIEKEKNWRHNYVPHIVKLTRLSVRSPSNALIIAKEGLAAVHELFEFIPAGFDYSIVIK